jgi:hypothetical protein
MITCLNLCVYVCAEVLEQPHDGDANVNGSVRKIKDFYASCMSPRKSNLSSPFFSYLSFKQSIVVWHSRKRIPFSILPSLLFLVTGLRRATVKLTSLKLSRVKEAGSCMASPGICIWLNDESCDMHVMYYDVVPFCICRAGCMMDSFLFSDFPLDGQHCRLADDWWQIWTMRILATSGTCHCLLFYSRVN